MIKDEAHALIDDKIPTNGLGEISAADVREVLHALVDALFTSLYATVQWSETVAPFAEGDLLSLVVTVHPDLLTLPTESTELVQLFRAGLSGNAVTLEQATPVSGQANTVMLDFMATATVRGGYFTITLTDDSGQDWSYTVNIDSAGYPDKPAI